MRHHWDAATITPGTAVYVRSYDLSEGEYKGIVRGVGERGLIAVEMTHRDGEELKAFFGHSCDPTGAGPNGFVRGCMGWWVDEEELEVIT